jgi:hypothetical protein
VGGNDDPYGNAAMNAFLKGYQRITCAEACGLGDVDLRHVTVWFKRAAKWERHQADDLLKGQDLRQSICRALVTRLYGWTPWQYDSLRDTFDDASSKDVMGIYATRRGDYAIVGRLPVSDRLVRSAIGIGGIMTGVGGMALKDYLSSDDAEKKELANSAMLNLQLKLAYFLLPKFAELVDNKNESKDQLKSVSKLKLAVHGIDAKDLVDHKEELLRLVSSMQNHFFNGNVKGENYSKGYFDQSLKDVIKVVNERYQDGVLGGPNPQNPRQSKRVLMKKLVEQINLTYEALFPKIEKAEKERESWLEQKKKTE